MANAREIAHLAVDMSEIRRECQKHPEIDGCSECPLCRELPGHSDHRQCLLDWPPAMWPAYLEMYQLLQGGKHEGLQR